MKATGIVRRIDDLGRVVIPKEIRRTLRIREGDPVADSIDTVGAVLCRNGRFGQTKWVELVHNAENESCDRRYPRRMNHGNESSGIHCTAMDADDLLCAHEASKGGIQTAISDRYI